MHISVLMTYEEFLIALFDYWRAIPPELLAQRAGLGYARCFDGTFQICVLGIKPIGWEIYHKWRDLDGFGAFKVCFSKEILGSKQPLGGQHQDPDTLGDLASSIGI